MNVSQIIYLCFHHVHVDVALAGGKSLLWKFVRHSSSCCL